MTKAKIHKAGDWIFVHRFKFSHYSRQRQLKKMLLKKEAKILEKSKEGILYQILVDRRIN